MKRYPGMNCMRAMLLAFALIAAACGGEESVASKSAAAYREAQAQGIPVGGGHDHGGHGPTGTAAATDHSAHGTGADAHAGMDHGAAAGGAVEHRGHGGASAADHAAMGHSTGAANAHAGHGSTSRGTAADHAAMGHGSSANDAHAGHGAPGRTTGADHAAMGHGSSRRADAHAGHTATPSAHAQHGARTTAADAHAGHGAAPNAAATHDRHAGMQHPAPAATAHAQHGMHPTAGHAGHGQHGAMQMPAASNAHAQHGTAGTAGAPTIAPAPRSNAEIQRITPAATLQRDAFDAAAPIAVAEAVKAAHGGHDGHQTRGITPGEDHENPPTPMPATRDGSSTAPATDHSQHGASAGSQQGQPAAAAVYSCPMHPDVTSDKPGTCPKCGMALVKK